MPGSSSTIRMRAPAPAMSVASSMGGKMCVRRNARMSHLKPRCYCAHSPPSSLIREHHVGDERVGLALVAEGRHRAVPRHETDVFAERPQLAGDGLDQVPVAAAREVGAANGALEENVSDLGEPRLAVE